MNPHAAQQQPGSSPDVDHTIALIDLPHKQLFHPLGLPVEITTNDTAVLDIAAALWSHSTAPISAPTIHIRILVSENPEDVEAICPPPPLFNGQQYLLSFVADAQNHATCDLRSRFGFSCITRAALQHPLYLRYYFLGAMALAMISATHAPALHAACISINGVGFLLCGPSGAGKSTLAFACARAGFTYTTDDASYLLAHTSPPRVLGLAHKLRFRPHARELFSELRHRDLTPRLTGKPSIEVPTSELPNIRTATAATIHHLILLDRHRSGPAALTPISTTLALEEIHKSLYPTPEVRRDQLASISGLETLPAHQLRYSSLDDAILCLQSLAS